MVSSEWSVVSGAYAAALKAKITGWLSILPGIMAYYGSSSYDFVI